EDYAGDVVKAGGFLEKGRQAGLEERLFVWFGVADDPGTAVGRTADASLDLRDEARGGLRPDHFQPLDPSELIEHLVRRAAICRDDGVAVRGETAQRTDQPLTFLRIA